MMWRDLTEAEQAVIDRGGLLSKGSRRIVMPVEPCEHDRIDGHIIDSLGGPQEWCLGAGIGDNDG